jgi:FAD/FMN-containing dehydrogenase
MDVPHFMSLKDDLQKVVKGEIIDDPEGLAVYSKDASIFEITPKLVIAPLDSEDIQNLVKYVSDHPDLKLSLTPRSAGTDMGGGPLSESIVLDMTKHFNKVIEVGDDFAITQPGVYYRDFEVETLKKDLLLPCYTASRQLNTVGGMVANNSAGEKTLLYGQTERYVKKLKVIFSDGNEYEVVPLTKEQLDKKMAQKDFEGGVYKSIFDLITQNQELITSAKPQVSKNTAGYYLWNVWDGKTFDLNKLLVGSQGTLGIVTEITFQLVHPKKHSRMLIVYMKNLDNLAEIVGKILDFKPESFESYDDQTLKVAMKFLPEVLKVMSPTNMLGLAFQFIPEAWMALVSGFPKLVLLAEFTGDTDEEVDKKAADAQAQLSTFNLATKITHHESEGKKFWTIRRESFNLLRHHSTHMRTAPFIDDIVVKPEVLPEFLPKIRALMDEYKDHMIYTIAGHVGNGNFHIIPLMDFTKPDTKQIILELSEKVYSLVFEYKGSMTAEHNDGLVRAPFLPKMYGDKVFALFKKVKTIFDPKDILNPHKKSEATTEYAMQFLSNPSHEHPTAS